MYFPYQLSKSVFCCVYSAIHSNDWVFKDWLFFSVCLLLVLRTSSSSRRSNWCLSVMIRVFLQMFVGLRLCENVLSSGGRVGAGWGLGRVSQ